METLTARSTQRVEVGAGSIGTTVFEDGRNTPVYAVVSIEVFTERCIGEIRLRKITAEELRDIAGMLLKTAHNLAAAEMSSVDVQRYCNRELAEEYQDATGESL